MTVGLVTTINRYIVLSADVKPASARLGSELIESDTLKQYVWSGSSWVQVN